MSPVRLLERDDEEFDYIICGGGTSGCVLAARLAAAFPSPDGPSVLLIEAGPDSANHPLITMVGGLFTAMGSELDWSIKTVPQQHLHNRVLSLNRGKFLGGSSGFNGTLCIRGSKADYDEWDLPGWSGDDMFRLMKKAETFHPKPWFTAAEGLHGTDGPLHVEPHDVAPISDRILDSMQDKGLTLVDDMFTTGEAPHACGHVPRTVHEGVRTFSADYLKGREERVNVVVSTVVDRIILERIDGELVATGVAVVDGAGNKRVVKAKKEILVSAGAYCSPTILLRSGIGPKAELEGQSIPCEVDLPGVGKNFQDHLVVFVPYQVSQPGLTNDRHVHHPNGLTNSLSEYQSSRSGFMSTFPFGVFGLARLDDALSSSPLWPPTSSTPSTTPRDPAGLLPSQSHVEYMHTELYSGHIHGPPPSPASTQAFEMMTLLFSQQSRGSVSLRSTNPRDNPVVDPNYLAHPLDLLLLTEGVRFAHDIIVSGRGTRDLVVGGAVWTDVVPGSAGTALASATTAREDWEEYVREYSATAHHPAGTCKMGRDDDPMAVVDAALHVRGVRGLRVADASVMPTLNGGHTQMPAYAIGERAAELVVEAAAQCGK